MSFGVRDLLRSLVSIPSVSGNEAAARDFVADSIAAAGVAPHRSGRNVWAMRGRDGPTLLWNSHVDTVPPAEGWTGDPWTPRLTADRLVGLGANDAKASVASMLAAFCAWDETIPGRILFAATCDEETGGQGLEVLVRELPPFDAAVVGEPNGFEVAVSQKGLVKLQCVANGRSGHAARPQQAENAIYRAARDIAKLEAQRMEARDPILGPPTLAVTMVQGGVKSNVIPDRCRFTIDARTIPAFDNATLIDHVRRSIDSDVEVLSQRLQPVAGDPASAIARAALASQPGSRVTGFDGVTDLVHVAHVPSIVFGPGSGAASHQPDEWIDLSALDAAPATYSSLARAYFALVPEAARR
ncbi:MAG: M20/M25/M40 family metallo-hydrolase [Planctomycetes bacterium]|nr:M20/M25/M40 family metallo-hydrolase [Planctomycetota bacterium]